MKIQDILLYLALFLPWIAYIATFLLLKNTIKIMKEHMDLDSEFLKTFMLELKNKIK